LHYDFGDSGRRVQRFTSGGVATFVTGSSTSRHLTADIVRTGIGYKFD
jgi:hypothetical protein